MTTDVDYQDELLDEAAYRPPADPVDAALGARGRLDHAYVADCREQFEGGAYWRDPETFDRQYWEPPLLVDLLDDQDAQTLAADRDRKHVDFKRGWCDEHGRAYLVLTLSQADDVDAARAAYAELTAAGGPEPVTANPPAGRAASKPRRRAASKLQRPRAE